MRIYVSAQPVDMRRGFDGLAALVRHFGHDVFSGHLFAFVSRRGDRAKVLWWERGGFVLWSKRLERGRFQLPRSVTPGSTVEIDGGQLGMLLDGVDIRCVKRPVRWEPARAA